MFLVWNGANSSELRIRKQSKNIATVSCVWLKKINFKNINFKAQNLLEVEQNRWNFGITWIVNDHSKTFLNISKISKKIEKLNFLKKCKKTLICSYLTGFARSMENLEKYGIDLSEKYVIRACSIEKYGIFRRIFYFSSHAQLLFVSILKRKKWINVVYKLHPKRLE